MRKIGLHDPSSSMENNERQQQTSRWWYQKTKIRRAGQGQATHAGKREEMKRRKRPADFKGGPRYADAAGLFVQEPTPKRKGSDGDA